MGTNAAAAWLAGWHGLKAYPLPGCLPSTPTTHTHTPHPLQGICTLRYKGPKPIGYGLRAAVRDKYPDIIEVLMLDADTDEPIKF